MFKSVLTIIGFFLLASCCGQSIDQEIACVAQDVTWPVCDCKDVTFVECNNGMWYMNPNKNISFSCGNDNPNPTNGCAESKEDLKAYCGC